MSDDKTENQGDASHQNGTDTSIWDRQGYSPLLPIMGGEGNNNMMAMATLNSMGTTMTTTTTIGEWGSYPSSGSDDDDSEAKVETGGHDENVTSGSGSNNVNTDKPTTQPTDPIDFRSLADQALKQLDIEYQLTVGKEIAPKPLSADSDVVEIREEKEAPEHKPEELSTHDFADWDTMMATELADGTDPSSDAATKSQTQEEEDEGEGEKPASKPLPNIDSDAVRRAMVSMQQKQAPSFASKYQQWAATSSPSSSEAANGLWAASLIVPQTHVCIPKTILRLFNASSVTSPSRSSEHHVSQGDDIMSLAQETQQLSRAATLVEALCRTDALRRQDILVVHLIGCDDQEQQDTTNNPIPAFLSPVLQWLPRARQVPHKIEFHLIGPGLNGCTSNVVEVRESLPAPLTSVSIQCHSDLYHEFLQKKGRIETDLVLSFHAGIWGYDSWKPTLKYLAEKRSKNFANDAIPFVITAYSLWEAEEDYEVMKDHFSSSSGESPSLLWKPQLNPFGSHLERPTETAPAQQKEPYRENAAWQAWAL